MRECLDSNKDLMSRLKSSLKKCEHLLHKVDKVYVYGSVARGTNRQDSDIDFILETNDRLSFDDHLAIEDFLNSELSKDIDLVTMKALLNAERYSRRPDRYHQIRKDMIEVWRKSV